MDGLDHDLAVLDASRQESLYRNYIVGRVAELGSIPVKDGEVLIKMGRNLSVEHVDRLGDHQIYSQVVRLMYLQTATR